MKTNLLGSYKGYLLEVNTNGQYRIVASNNFSSNTTTVLRDWTTATAIKTNAGKNTLQVSVHQGALSFAINGVPLAPALQDQTYTSGVIAFLATSSKGGQADIVYSTVTVSPQG